MKNLILVLFASMFLFVSCGGGGRKPPVQTCTSAYKADLLVKVQACFNSGECTAKEKLALNIGVSKCFGMTFTPNPSPAQCTADKKDIFNRLSTCFGN